MATKQRRATNYLPPYFRTPQNLREYTVADDMLYEPENASFIRGYIGSADSLSQTDLARVPLITETDASADAYQLSVGSAEIDPVTGVYQYAAFYTDLVNQIASNGGDVSDPNRLFGTNYYAWAPPIDYDRHINFASYFWTGPGDATENGEYMTREIAGSQTTIYEFNGTAMVAIPVSLVNGLGPVGITGSICEDASTSARSLYISNGTEWVPLSYLTVPSLPPIAGLLAGTYFYPTQTGPNFQRPVVQMYSAAAGRWIAQAVVVDILEPEYPITGMIWEDVRTPGIRTFKLFNGSNWNNLVYTSASYISGVGTDKQYVYDLSALSSSDQWSQQNWWRHFEDLSQYDRSQLLPSDQAVRPILEFWNGIERFPGDTKSQHNQSPKFATYHIDPTTYSLVSSGQSSTIMQYKIGTGLVDPILDLVPSYNNYGTFQFDMTLDESTAFAGYKYFRDARTGQFHSTWSRSLGQTDQHSISNSGPLSQFFDVPVGLTSNPNHIIPSVVSRSEFIAHMSAVISGQTNFFGNVTGINSYRWTARDPIVNATIIDPEHSLLRIMSTLQTPDLDVPDTIRDTCREYVRVLFRFVNRLNQLWDSLALNDGAGNLVVPVAQAVDSVLTMVFMSKSAESAYSLSDMGTYVETRSFNGVSTVVGTGPKPIYIPSSPPRLGLSPTFVPGTYTDRNGHSRLRGHDGSSIPSFGDQRDLVWLELQNRFFAAVPPTKKTETATVSSRHGLDHLYVQDFYGGYQPTLTIPNTVLQIVNDYSSLSNPPVGNYLSRLGPSYARWDGTNWGLTPVLVDDTFFNTADQTYYTYNAVDVVPIPTYNVGNSDYATNVFRRIIRRDFERWANDNGLDYALNPDFNSADPFTWNYSSVGVEGNYKGLYRRIYRTIRPDARPWEIAGYSIEPTWWRTQYVPTSVAPDGYPRYANNHSMWTDLRNGLVNAPLGITNANLAMIAPIPVDGTGTLLDPISAGIIPAAHIDTNRIADGWTYGDGGPVEQMFYDSPQYGFAVAMAGYLMKPGVWLDTYWITGYTHIEPIRIWNGPHLIHTKTLTRPGIADLPLHLSLDSAGNPVKQHGINEWVAENLYRKGLDPIGGFSTIVMNTSPVLSWKTAGFIDKNRTEISTLNGNQIPYEDLHVVLHQSKPFRTEFCSGVMITREGAGFRVFGYDASNPNFTIEVAARSTVGGQVELREQITLTPNQYTITLKQITMPRSATASDTATLAVLIGGLRVDSNFYRVTSTTTLQLDPALNVTGGELLEIVVLTTVSNPSTQLKTFIVGSVVYSYFSQGTGQYENVPYDSFFNNANEVINFMLGYGRFLQARGWVFEAQEPTTGAITDWLHGAQKFATWLQETASVSALQNDPNNEDFDIFYYSPTRYGAKFSASYGQALNVESIQNGLYGIITKLGQPMSTDGVEIVRTDDTIVIIPPKVFQIAGDNQIYGCRVYLTETQHIVVFSNTTKFNQIIYDPLFALYYRTLYVDTYRTNGWVGRLDAAGFIISGGTLLPNFEKQVSDFTRFYDRANPVDDPVKDSQAKNLVGYYPLDSYMDPLLADQRARFDYYRGMIKAKGTVRAIMAFAHGTTIGAPNLQIQEDWAWKMAEYGDTRRSLVQFGLSKTSLSTPVQVVRFGVPFDPSSQFIEVPDLDRTQPIPSDNPWLIPPVPSNAGISMMRFPTDKTGQIDYADYKYITNLFDTNTEEAILSTFIFDPARGLYEPNAYEQLDFVTFFDPALYNTGAKAVYSNNLSWGPERVGQQWFSPEATRYFDYHSMVPDYTKASKYWGMPLFFVGQISRVGNLVTITTVDAITGTVAPHGFRIGSTKSFVTVSGADQDGYNGVYNVSVPNSTQLTYTITTVPATPATGNIRVDVNLLNVWEWVESPVPPTQWASYTASLTDPNAPGGVVPFANTTTSYSQITSVDAQGNAQTLYYFWVINNPAPSPLGRPFTSKQLEDRLRDPTSQGIPWMAVVDPSTMLIYLGGQTLTATSGLEVVVDGRSADTHIEWALVTEGSRINIPPDSIWNKIEDSISGIDTQGNVVPYPGYTDTEKYGTDFYPAQTVFVTPTDGYTVWQTLVNQTFSARDFSADPQLLAEFLLVNEFSSSNPNGYWIRSSYLNPEYAGKPVFETVGTLAERDYRAANGYYRDGDLVSVVITTRRDPWTGNPSGATYVYDGTTFTEIGATVSTVQILPILNTLPNTFRNVFETIRPLFEPEENSAVLIGLFQEILRQSGDCDWCFKTSYITAHITDTLRQDAFIHPDQTEAIYQNILDVKPYRTKFRSETITYGFSQEEAANVQVAETVDEKITLLFDRLSSSTFDDGGYDTFGNDRWRWGYDRPLWELTDYGRGFFIPVGTVVGNGVTTEFTITPKHDPNLYTTQTQFYVNGTLTDLTTLGNSVTVGVNGKSLDIDFAVAPLASHSLTVLMSVGFVQGIPPVLGSGLDDEFSVFQSDYQHLAARLIAAGRGAEAAALVGSDMNDPLGGYTEERIRSNYSDGLLIGVTTTWSGVMGGWGGSPYDTTPFDMPPTNIGPRVFFQAAGPAQMYPPGLTVLPTSEDIIATTSPYVVGVNHDTVVQILRSHASGPFVALVPNVDYTTVPLFGNIIKLTAPVAGDVIRYVFNGWNVGPLGTYQVTAAPGNYDIVNGVLTLTTPIANSTISLVYNVARYQDTPLALLARNAVITDDIMSNHLIYDSGGFETNRPVGLTHVNTTNSHQYQWTGTAWTDLGALATSTVVFAKRLGQIWQNNGPWVKVYQIGDAFGLPVLTYPSNGAGIVSGTYQIGQLADAAANFPAAYAVIQYPGATTGP